MTETTTITETKEEVKSFRKTIETFLEDVTKTVRSDNPDDATYESIRTLFRELKSSKKEFDKNSASEKSKKVRIKIENKKSNKIKNKMKKSKKSKK